MMINIHYLLMSSHSKHCAILCVGQKELVVLKEQLCIRSGS